MTVQLGLVVHQHREEVWDLARRAIAWCGDKVKPRLPPVDARLVGREDLAVAEPDFPHGLDGCLSLGGDGTMLRTAQLVAVDDVPILGVNAGRLGYLTEVEPSHLTEALDAWMAGRMTVEERMMVEVVSDIEGPDGRPFSGSALNEAVIYRSDSGRTVEVLATIGGNPFNRYLADGVIVATPTGSTAYSLSAGGPIVEPDFRALILTPVAAHMVFNRSMVLAPTTDVMFTILGHRGAVLSLDGYVALELDPGQSITCRASKHNAKLLVTGERDFHTVLKEKFHLVDRR
jgi:NAD+ kinase